MGATKKRGGSGARVVILSLLVVWLSGGLGAPAWAAPKAELWRFWDRSDEQDTRRIDHGEWQRLLDRYLVTEHASGVFRFDYQAVTADDKRRLSAYIRQLAQPDPRTYRRREQKAYWINLYNALTVQRVLQKYPVASIKQTGNGFFSFGPWDDEVVRIAGQWLTLNDIEHRILRPIWRDHRIHYAVNCASVSCPPLWPQAFTGDTVERLLAEAQWHYINSAQGVRFRQRRLVLSSIYEWYRQDFADTEAGLLRYLAAYARPELAERLRRYDGPIRYEYDWSLNQP